MCERRSIFKAQVFWGELDTTLCQRQRQRLEYIIEDRGSPPLVSSSRNIFRSPKMKVLIGSVKEDEFSNHTS
jgi:hypothetical protein